MHRKLLIAAAALAIIATIVTAAGCGGSSTTSSQSSTSDASSATQAASSTQTTQDQSQNPDKGQGKNGPRMDNTRLLARVAEILNVSVDNLTTAYNNAMPKRTDGTGTPPSGMPPTGTQRSGTPPADDGTQPGGTPPADGQKGQPREFSLPDDVIQQIASELSLSTDTVSSAFKQAMSELQASSTK
jgi:hypothetical protein